MLIVFGTVPFAGWQAGREVRSLVPREVLIQDAIALRRYIHRPTRDMGDASNFGMVAGASDFAKKLSRWFRIDRPVVDNGPEIIVLETHTPSNSDSATLEFHLNYPNSPWPEINGQEIHRKCEAAKEDYLKLLPYYEKYAIHFKYPLTARYCHFPASFILAPSQIDQRYLGFMAHAQAHGLSEHGMPVWHRSRRLIKLLSATFCFAALAWLAGVAKYQNILASVWVLPVVAIALILFRPNDLLLRNGGTAISLRAILLCMWAGSVVVVWRRQCRDLFQEYCVIAAVLLPIAMVALDWVLDWALNWRSYDHPGWIVPIWWWHDFIKVDGFLQIELLLPLYCLMSIPLSYWLDRYRSLPHRLA